MAGMEGGRHDVKWLRHATSLPHILARVWGPFQLRALRTMDVLVWV